MDKPTVAQGDGKKSFKLNIIAGHLKIGSEDPDKRGIEMHRHGFSLLELAAIICILILVLAIFLPRHDHNCSIRPACASNLRQIYTAMYTYSQDYKGAFPEVLPSQIILGEDTAEKNMKPGLKDNPFKDFPAMARHSVSENLWLLCRGDFVEPAIFICPGSEEMGNKVNVRDVINSTTGGVGPEYYVNFPWEDKEGTISYSFIQPWSRFGDKGKGSRDMWSANTDPKFVLGADANNSRQPDFKGEDVRLTFKEMKKHVNSTNHAGDGQNVLFGNGHVSWHKSSYVGIEQDNIFTALPGGYSGKAGETPGILSVRPKDEKDTVLIPNRDADLAKWNRKP